MTNRYFVDQRPGCVAVCDSQVRQPGIGHLGEHAPGVCGFWLGDGHEWTDEWTGKRRVQWAVPGHKIRAAVELCEKLNREEADGSN